MDFLGHLLPGGMGCRFPYPPSVLALIHRAIFSPTHWAGFWASGLRQLKAPLADDPQPVREPAAP